MKTRKLERIRRQLNFRGFWYVEPVGLSGGLALWWRETDILQVDESLRNHIDATIIHSIKGPWRVTFIYGNPTFCERRKLWSRLAVGGSSQTEPRLCTGDFNDILL